jgi:hypothetical protein
MLDNKLKDVLSKKTPSQRRAFFRLLNHFTIKHRDGKEVPTKIKKLIEGLETGVYPFY